MDALSQQVYDTYGPFEPVPRATLIALCRKYGAQVTSYSEGAEALFALAGNESSFGTTCNPRHEASWCLGGPYYDSIHLLTQNFGHAAHCSYGPWQTMFANCPGAKPADLQDPECCAQYAVRLLNGHPGFQHLTEIGEFWNGGHVGAAEYGWASPSNVALRVRAYCAKLMQSATVPME